MNKQTFFNCLTVSAILLGSHDGFRINKTQADLNTVAKATAELALGVNNIQEAINAQISTKLATNQGRTEISFRLFKDADRFKMIEERLDTLARITALQNKATEKLTDYLLKEKGPR